MGPGQGPAQNPGPFFSFRGSREDKWLLSTLAGESELVLVSDCTKNNQHRLDLAKGCTSPFQDISVFVLCPH